MSATHNQTGPRGLESRLQAAPKDRLAQAGTPNLFARTLTTTSWMAAAFCAFVCAAMLYQHQIAAEHDPWKSPTLLALKEKLRATPSDELLRGEIRRLDLEFRQRYFRRLALNVTGGWLLVAGVGALLLAAKSAKRLTQPLPRPQRRMDAQSLALEAASRARWSVAGVGAVVGTGLLALAFTSQSPLSDRAADANKLLAVGESAVTDSPTLAEFQANWPRFRGPDGGGAVKGEWKLSFDGTPGGNVIWKSPIPAIGYNSAVVWSNRVFLSGGDIQKREVFCYDAGDGKLLWQHAVENVPGSPAKLPEISEATGYAASTMATDGRRAFVIFANGDLAAFNFDGSPAWTKHLGLPKNMYGHASSLAIWPGKLVVQLDQDEGAPGGSKLLAFACATGRPLWERTKPTHGSWASPIIVEAAGKTQIITVALPHVVSSSLADGTELWRAELMEGEITPSPIFAGGFVLAVNPSSKLHALRPDGAGDVTKSHIAWTAEENIPDVTSPVSNGELVFTVSSSGMLTCFDVKDGKKVWQKDLEMEVQSSPAIAGNRLFVLSTKGDAVLAEAGREFKELGRAKFEDTFHASPAFAGGRIFLRGATNLWCLGEKR
jgi:outer membrane protein assembly factor BamB